MQHQWKLIGEVKVIVLCEINILGVALGKQDLQLFRVRGSVTDPVDFKENQIFGCEITLKKRAILFRTSIENRPELHSKRPKGITKRPQANFRLAQLVVAERQALRRLRDLGINPVRNRNVIPVIAMLTHGSETLRPHHLKSSAQRLSRTMAGSEYSGGMPGH